MTPSERELLLLVARMLTGPFNEEECRKLLRAIERVEGRGAGTLKVERLK